MSLFADGIDSRAIVHDGAEIAQGCSVGPFSVIGPGVSLGAGTRVGSHVVLDGTTRIGERNTIFPFCAIGLPPQDLKYAGEPTRVVIGDGNTFREYCQVHRGTGGGGGVTRIGNDGFFMVSSHVAHDCVLGDNVLFANAATLAGHAEVEDHATIGAYSGVHQFCRVGRHAFIGGYSVVTRDALPYCLTVGDRATCYGPNRVGLLRRGVAKETVKALDAAARAIFRTTMTREEALAEVEREYDGIREVQEMVSFIRNSKRGVIPIRLGAGG